MPQLGETVTEGTILTWLKQPGEVVEIDDGLFEVSTEKVDTEIPSAVAGVLRVQLVDEGETVPIGTPVAVITATADEALDLAELAGTPARYSVPPGSGAGSGAPAGDSTADESDESDESDGSGVTVVIGPAVGEGSAESDPGRAESAWIPSSEARSTPSDPDSAVVGTDSVQILRQRSDPDSADVGTDSVQNLRQRTDDDDAGDGDGDGAGGTETAGVISPVVRRLMAEHGLTPREVVGSGRDGRITRADVAAAVAHRDAPVAGQLVTEPTAPAVQPGGGGPARPREVRESVRPPVVVGERDEVIDFSRTRAATAAHMIESLSTAAHALVVVTVDYAAIDAVRRRAGLSYLPFIARAVVEAISEFPHLNASVIDDEQGQRLVVHRDVNLGVAVDVDQEALMVPVVHGADQMRIGALSGAITDLAERARRRRLAGEALSGGTFTITNVGAHGTLVTMPIINQPQVAILSTDGVRMTPVAVPLDEGSWGIAVHPVGNLCLSFDHRAFDGAYAAAFLARVRSELEERDWEAEVTP